MQELYNVNRKGTNNIMNIMITCKSTLGAKKNYTYEIAGQLFFYPKKTMLKTYFFNKEILGLKTVFDPQNFC